MARKKKSRKGERKSRQKVGRKRAKGIHTWHYPEQVARWRAASEDRGMTLTELIEEAMEAHTTDRMPDRLALEAELALNGVVYLLKGEATRDEALTRQRKRAKARQRSQPKKDDSALNSIRCAVCSASHSAEYCPRCGTGRG